MIREFSGILQAISYSEHTQTNYNPNWTIPHGSLYSSNICFLPHIQQPKEMRLIAAKFCTCTNSTAVGACAKFCGNMILEFEATENKFPQIWLKILINSAVVIYNVGIQ